VDTSRDGLTIALELLTLGEEMVRTKARRQDASLSPEQIEERVRAWRQQRRGGHDELADFTVVHRDPT